MDDRPPDVRAQRDNQTRVSCSGGEANNDVVSVMQPH